MSRADTKVITIGRDPDNTVILASSNVSAHHARLIVSADRIVLEDLQSTNGTSVRRVENKTTRAVISESDSVFFGSAEYVVAEILQLAKRSTASSHGAPAVAEKPILSASSVVTWKKTAVVLAVVSVAVLIWLSVRNVAEPVGETTVVDSIETEILDVASASKGDQPASTILGQADSAAGVAAPEVDSSVKDTAQQDNTDAFETSQALYIVLCREMETNTPFRVGTAFAIDDGRIVTSASVIRGIRKLLKDGFASPELYSPHLNRSITIEAMHVHPMYSDTADQLDSLMENDGDRETVMALLNSCLAVDFGILKISVSVPAGFTRRDETPRPGQKLHVTGYPFDVDDPFFDASIAIQLDSLDARAQDLHFLEGSQSGSLILQLVEEQVDQRELSFIGSPILNSQDQVVGIYTRPHPNNKSEADQFEGALIQHLSEISVDE